MYRREKHSRSNNIISFAVNIVALVLFKSKMVTLDISFLRLLIVDFSLLMSGIEKHWTTKGRVLKQS